MNEQLSMQDVLPLKPDYRGSRNEIIRLSIERDFERSIQLLPCTCKHDPISMFRSSTEYFVKCPGCGSKTKMYRHTYEAKQAWNRGIRE